MLVHIAAVQMAAGSDPQQNLAKLETRVRQAAADGANLVVTQELVAHRFFLNFGWDPDLLDLAEELEQSTTVAWAVALAAELGVVLPVNFLERAGQVFYNTTAVVDADGRVAGTYRKTHMPLGSPTCYEKYYTTPGDGPFEVFDTAAGRLGCAICWDQWFPEVARILCLRGADLLLYPTAIGSDCHDQWQTVMRGHAAANLVPVVAVNRVGTESDRRSADDAAVESDRDAHRTTYWGRSFIADGTGRVVAQAGEADDETIVAEVDLAAAKRARNEWAVFRDRRPDLYRPLLTKDGRL
ncbi:MAG: nitrilase-related carbon-nitrogen hydrolase [Actinomycetota bacterium]